MMQRSINRLLDMADSNVVQDPLSQSRSVDEKVPHLSHEEWPQWVVERLRPRITTYFPEMEGMDCAIACVSMGGDYAKTFKLDITGNGLRKVVFFKLCPIFRQLNPGTLEFNTLELLHDRLPKLNPNCAVARPLEFFQDWNAYAMESVVGENFKDRLLQLNSKFSGARSLTQLRAAVSKCGEWLKYFHAITKSPEPRPFATAEYVASIEEELELASLKRVRFDRSVLAKLDATLTLLPRLDGCPMPCAKWHWDYTPAHVFLDGDRVSVIDITGSDDAPIYEDVGHFLSALVTVNNLPWFPLYDRRRADGLLCDTFLEVYGGGEANDKATLFANVYKLKCLLLWFNAQHCHVRKMLPQHVANGFVDYRLTRIFEPPLLSAINKIETGMMSVSRAK
jgi:hypothetical protein